MGKLFLLFTVVPILDLWLLVRLSAPLGPAGTLLLIVGPSLLGAWLARREGMRVLRAWQRALQDGRMPEEGLISAALVLAGGVLLVTPGLITDATGLALLVPAIRKLAVRGVRAWLRVRIARGTVRVVTFAGGHPGDEPIDVTPRGPAAPPPAIPPVREPR